MLVLMPDAFAQAVEDARQRLIRVEGRNVSVREVARRAGVPHSTLAYNLNAEGRTRRIDRDLIHALAQVLPIDEDELLRAAQVASGYTLSEPEFPDLGAAVVRFLDSDEVSDAEKRRLRARLADILAEEMRKAADAHNNGQ